jgi:hypothetical protein
MIFLTQSNLCRGASIEVKITPLISTAVADLESRDRLGLCRCGLSLPPPVPLPAKLRDCLLAGAIRFADDVAACTSHAATSRAKTSPFLSHAAFASRISWLPGPPPPTQAANDFVFSLRHKRRCSAATLGHWPCRWRSDTAPMSPLRAVVPRGHIAPPPEFTAHSRFV